jgi:hypothetical protein
MGARLMMMTMLSVLGAILLGVLANDLWTLSTPIARRLVVWAAGLWARDHEQRETLTEEWRAYIDDRPGQVLKLVTASALIAAGFGRMVSRRFRIGSRSSPQIAPPMRVPSWVPVVDTRAAESAGVPASLVVGLLSSVAPMIFLAEGTDTRWAFLCWGFGSAVAVLVAGGSVFGFLVDRPAAIPLDSASLTDLARVLAAPPESATQSFPTETSQLVRPFVQADWAGGGDDTSRTRLVRPYVQSGTTAENP